MGNLTKALRQSEIRPDAYRNISELLSRVYDLEKRLDSNSEIVLTAYDPLPERSSVSNLHGGFDLLVSGDSLSSGNDITFNQGLGKFVIVLNSGSDATGMLTVSGTSVDRESGALTPSDINDILVSGLTTNTGSTDANGNIVHGFTNAYITNNWFTGAITISTSDLNLSDVDIYHCSFEQFNDTYQYRVETLDVNLYATAINAEFDCYLYSIAVNENICVVSNDADLHIGAGGVTPITNRYYRLRKGNIDNQLSGNSDGIWIEVFYSTSPARIEDVTIKVWAKTL